jgi:uncharacterized protein (TIGR02611 family)
MNGTTRMTARTHELLRSIETWAHRGPLRAVVVKVAVSVVGPLVVAAGVAMLVLPGPGLVVMGLGTALLALEYDWARRLLGGCGRTLDRGRRAVISQDASPRRRVLAAAATVFVLVATTGLTAVVTTYVGTTFV